jgi:hypothetical protein
MTPRADRLIDILNAENAKDGTPFDVELSAACLRQGGFNATEVGWVLHHTFNLSMPEAVHIATLTPDPASA